MLFGRITDYTVRMGIRAPLMSHGQEEPTPLYHGTSPNATSTTFPTGSASLPQTTTYARGSSPAPPASDPRDAPGFRALDKLVSVDFINSFPPHFRSPLGVGEFIDGNHLDTDLYMAHLVPHAYVFFLLPVMRGKCADTAS